MDARTSPSNDLDGYLEKYIYLGYPDEDIVLNPGHPRKILT